MTNCAMEAATCEVGKLDSFKEGIPVTLLWNLVASERFDHPPDRCGRISFRWLAEALRACHCIKDPGPEVLEV